MWFYHKHPFPAHPAVQHPWPLPVVELSTSVRLRTMTKKKHIWGLIFSDVKASFHQWSCFFLTYALEEVYERGVIFPPALAFVKPPAQISEAHCPKTPHWWDEALSDFVHSFLWWSAQSCVSKGGAEPWAAAACPLLWLHTAELQVFSWKGNHRWMPITEFVDFFARMDFCTQKASRCFFTAIA